uniref:Uncharacterized protein n=1 Tax=Rhizophora mucronata TaxID=61149 RepID=A0A2P2QW84_RHIMU
MNDLVWDFGFVNMKVKFLSDADYARLKSDSSRLHIGYLN